MSTSLSPTATKIIIILSNILFGLAFVPSLGLTLVSVMLFDSPGSADSLFTVMLFWSIASFPLFVLLSFVGSWVFYNQKKFIQAILFGVLPLLSLVFVGISLLLMNFICDGMLACQ